MEPKLEKIDIPGYEEVYHVTEPSVGLQAIIAIHSTQRGPAVGGARIFPYLTLDQALNDALRLSKGMTYKSLLADLHLGGGKGVIMADPRKEISEGLLRAYGKAVHTLQGRYFTAEDSGMNQERLHIIRKETPYVLGLESEESSGNPCPSTAWGTLRGIQATLYELTGSCSLKGKIVALQGVGFVGEILAELLFWEGAKLLISDICPEKVEKICKLYDATAVAPDEIYDAACDVFSPCALGAILNENTIGRLKCKAIAGCSNNQLATPEAGVLLAERGILYAPDVIVNAGGVINVERELQKEDFRPSRSRDNTNKIYDRLITLFALAKASNITTDQAAIVWAEEKMQQESLVCSAPFATSLKD